MRASHKKALRITAYVFGGIFLVLFLAIAGVLIWLRTDSGLRTVAGIATDALAAQGIILKTESFDGPLPSRLHLTGVSLADAKGEWLAAKELDVRLDLLALLGKTAALHLVRVDSPQLFRLPELPPAAQEPPAEPAMKESGFFKLPIGVRLDRLSLENIGLYAPLVFSETGPETKAVPGKPLFTLTVTGNAAAKAERPLSAVLSVDAAVADMQQLAALTGESSEKFPLDAFALRADLKALVGEFVEAELAGTATPGKNGESYPLNYGAKAKLLLDMLALPEFFVHGLDLSLDGAGAHNLTTGESNAKITFDAKDGGKWEDLAAALTGRRMGGGVTLKAGVAMHGGGAFSGTADLTGTGMRWGEEGLQKILGSSLVLKAAGKGGKETYSLDLETLEAGIFSASGNADFAASTNKAKAALQAAVSDISPLLPGASGALTMTADVSGAFDEPDFSLTVTSDSVEHAGAALGGVNAALQGKASLKAEKSVRATATASLEKSPAGPVTFRTGLDAAQDARGNLDAHLSGLALNLAGAEVAADIEAAVPAAQKAGSAAPVIRGEAKAQILDWRPLAALTGVPLSGGGAQFTARFSHNGAAQRLTADIRAESLAMQDAFSISNLAGNIEAENITNPDIILNVTTGKSEAGPFYWESGAAAVRARRGDGSFAVSLRTDKTAQKSLAALQSSPAATAPGKRERLSVSGKFSLPASGTSSGTSSGTAAEVVLDRFAAKLPDSPTGVYLASPVTVSLGSATEVKGLKLNVVPGKGVMEANARFSGASTQAEITAKELPFRLIREATGAPVPDGKLNAAVVVTRNGASVTGKVEADAVMSAPPAAGQKVAISPPVAFKLASTLDRLPDPNFPELKNTGNMARLKGTATLALAPETNAGARNVAPGGQSDPGALIKFNFPLLFSAEGIPSPAEQAPLRANLFWRGEVAPLWALAPMPDRVLSGMAQVDADLKGSLSSPSYTASAYLGDGKFEDNILGLLLTKIAVEAESDSEKGSRLVLRAEDLQNGFVALEAGLKPGEAGGVPHVDARGHINRLQPLHRDDLFLRLSGRLAVSGPVSEAKVDADIEVERGEFSLLTSLGGGVRTLELSEPGAKTAVAEGGPTCDIKVRIPNRFFIRGRGLDSEWQGNLAVAGPLSHPSLTGSLHPVRGTFDLLSRPFSFAGGDITFFGGDRINPGLNLTLTYESNNITAEIHATGTAKKPEITLDSSPSLPRDQILAEVLFGKEFSRLSRFEALQVANSVRELANIGGGNGISPLTTMRTALGIDMLRVGSSSQSTADTRSISGAPGADTLGGGGSSGGDDSEATPTLQAGKYINDVIYVGVEQGITADSTGVRIEVELRPNLTLLGRTSTRSNEVGLGWKRDY